MSAFNAPYMPSPENGPYDVALKRGVWMDDSRGGRSVPYKIYVPLEHTHDRIPVIVWSHGYGGNRDGAAFLSRYLASYGYGLLHITHIGTDSSLWEGQAGHPWDILKNIKVSREITLARFKDVPFALDQLPVLMSEHPELAPLLDTENLGVSGHSFGAMTSQVMAGQMFPDENGILTRFHEPRFRAGILYSPVPVRHLVGEDIADSEIYGPISLPLLHMTGTEDDSPIEHFGYRERLAVHDFSDHPEKYVQILQGGDHMVYNGTRGKLAVNPHRETHENLIKMTALAFWDAFLKDDARAKDWLEKGGAQDIMGQHGEFKVQAR